MRHIFWDHFGFLEEPPSVRLQKGKEIYSEYPSQKSCNFTLHNFSRQPKFYKTLDFILNIHLSDFIFFLSHG